MTTAGPHDTLHLTADVAIEAAGDSTRRPAVAILAYTGGVMRVGGFGDVAIDLANLESPPSVPLLADHNASLDGIIGKGTPHNNGSDLRIHGDLVDTEQARRITTLAKDGVPLSASVGVEPLQTRFYRAGESVRLNGRDIEAGTRGLTVVEKGRLRETSIVVIGADHQSETTVAATRGQVGGNTVPKNQQTTSSTTPSITAPGDGSVAEVRAQAIAEERQRIERIDALCNDPRHRWSERERAEVDSIRAAAVRGDIEEHEVRERLLALIRASRPSGPTNYHSDTDVAVNADVLSAGILSLLGREDLAEKELGATTAQRARDLRATCMMDLVKASLRADNATCGSGANEMIRAALSLYSLPTALGNAANKVLLSAYQESPATWRSFANIRSANDFKDHSAIRPTAVEALDEVALGGELKHTDLGESVFSYSVDTFGRILTIDRRDIINDDLGVFQDNAMAFGRAAARSLADLVYKTLLANAGSFFSSGNGNLLTGAGSALGTAALENAIEAMMTQRDDDDNDLDIRPRTLVVPPELSQTAKALLESDNIERAVDTPTGNPFKNAVALEIEPRLSNSSKFTGSSTTAWYLFASPLDAAMIVAFLRGQQQPTVEFFGFDSDPNRLGATWRVYHDYGCVLGDYRAAVKADGA